MEKGKKVEKQTYLIKCKPGTFFMEVSEQKIENNLSLNDIIKNYISAKELKKDYDAICFFVIEERIGKRKKATKCHIGEIYDLEKIEKELGKNSPLYRNISGGKYESAIKYIPGNFGGVEKKDIVYSKKEIIEIKKQAKMEEIMSK